MNKQQKQNIIDSLAENLTNNNIFYLADTSELSVSDANRLRRLCFTKKTNLTVVKNTLLKKAMEKVEGKDFSELYDVLVGPTSIMFSEVGNVPAKVIKEFRKKSERPILKAALIDDAIYIGDENLQALIDLKSKEELIGEIILLLQSPLKNVLSSLNSGGQTISGLIKAIGEKNA